MAAMTMQHADFSARIARIEKGTGISKSTLFVGADEVYSVNYAARARRKESRLANVWYPLSVAMTFVVGALSDLVLRWIDWMTKGVPAVEADPGYAMVTGFFTALIVSLILGAILGIRVSQYLGLRALGIVAGMVGWHNAVHEWPDVFAMAFSPLWVGVVTRMTEPHSIYWLGNSISF
jgi:hypothetical protein